MNAFTRKVIEEHSADIAALKKSVIPFLEISDPILAAKISRLIKRLERIEGKQAA